MKICAVNFSYANNSMGWRGLKLLNNIKPFESNINVLDYDIPVCNSNRADGYVPLCVENLFNDMNNHDAYIFSVAEYSGAYCVGFKNIMDWFVVKTFYNSTLGQGYPFTNKPVAIVTFTPTTKNGNRHFSMSEKLLDKLGATVSSTHVFQDGWNTVLPNNSDYFVDDYNHLLQELENVNINQVELHPKAQQDAQHWVTKYEEWNDAWKHCN